MEKKKKERKEKEQNENCKFEFDISDNGYISDSSKEEDDEAKVENIENEVK